MQAERPFGAIYDQTDHLPVTRLPDLFIYADELGADFKPDVDKYFEELFAIMLECIIAEMDDVMNKTDAARQESGGHRHDDSHTFAYRAGHKLGGVLERADAIKAAFYRGYMFGLIAPGPASKEDPEPFLKKLTAAKAQLAAIKALQKSRLLVILAMLSWTSWAYLTVNISLRAVAASITTYTKLYTSQVLENAAEDDWETLVAGSITALVVLYFAENWAVGLVQTLCDAKLEQEFGIKLRTTLFGAILRQDTVYFEETDAHAIKKRIQFDTSRVQYLLFWAPVQILDVCFRVTGELYFLKAKCPGMIWTLLATLTIAIPLGVWAASVYEKVLEERRRIQEAIGAKTDEIIENLPMVREFAREKQDEVLYGCLERRKGKSEVVLTFVWFGNWPLVELFIMMGTWSNLHYGASLVHSGAMKSVDVLSTQHSIASLVTSIKRLIHQLLPAIMLVEKPIERIFRLLEARSLIEPVPGEDTITEDFVITEEFGCTDGKKGGIDFKFEGVTFAYPTLREHNVLRKMSMHIPAGKSVALVGEAGCGKSTVLQLCKRAYDVEPGNGQVLLNGKPIGSWDVRQLRRSIAIVSQDIHLFKGTIKENILYGLEDGERLERKFDGPEASTMGHAALVELAKKACAWKFIKMFPLQFETKIGAGGIRLSGGQKQRIAIARALVKEPACLLLDEATSALDSITQNEVAASLAAEQKRLGFTIIQIAHRLTTLLTSDVVHFIQHGAVVESELTNDGTACQKLRNKKVNRAITRSLSGDVEEVVTDGYFRDLWESAHVM